MNQSVSASADFAPAQQENATCTAVATFEGDFLQWFPITITFDGPYANENDISNPFRDYRMDVTFVSENGTTKVVPGYFAADGNAANTSATAGNKWRVHFVPTEPGQWTYTASFRSGKNVAISDDPSTGLTTSFHGATGTLNIGVASPNQIQGFVGQGPLEYVGEHYFRFAGSGKYYLKNGADSPENVLGYRDFDQTYFTGTSEFDNTHDFAPHIQDWNPGDPVWQGDKGKGLIGALNYLESQNVNSVYFLTYNIDTGDGKDVWMWTDPSVRDRYDVSKLAQWEIVFNHMSESGIQLHVVTQERENDEIFDNYGEGNYDVRRLYYRELVARFSHHPAVIWNIGEENDNTDGERLGFAEYIRNLDPYDHPITVHTDNNVASTWYDGLLGSDFFEATSIQGSADRYHDWAVELRSRSAAAGRPWAIYGDEQGPEVFFSMENVTELVRDAMWGNLMGGGAGAEWYFGADRANDWGDLESDNWRDAEQLWVEAGYAITFFQEYLPFWEMAPNNNLIAGVSDANAFAKVGQIYAVHFPSGTSSYNPRLVLPDNKTYTVKWFDPRNGGALQNGTVTQISGAGEQAIGQAPNNRSQHWVALIEQVPLTPPTAPSNLSVTALSSTAVELNWQDNSNDETGFQIWRQTATGIQLLNTVSSNVTSVADTGLQPNTEYCYQIRAFNSAFNSEFTSLACGTTNANQLPVITPIADVNMTEGEVASVAVTATDPDGDLLTGSVESAPGFATFQAPNIVQLAPQVGDAGDYTIIVQAEDIYGGITQASFAVSVATQPGGAPTLSVIADQNSTVGDAISLQVNATDPDNDTLTYGAQSLPNGLTINTQSGLISGTIAPDADGLSPYTVTVSVQDTELNTVETSFTWVVSPLLEPPNSPSNLVATATSDTTVRLDWLDNADDELSFEVWRQTPTGFELARTVDANVITFEDSLLQAETEYCYRVRAVNTDFNSAFSNLACATTQAAPLNQVPIIQAIADVTLTEGGAESVTVQASDPDGDAVTISMTSAPAFAQFLAPDAIQLTPQIGDAGNYTITVQAADTNSDVTSLTFNVSVATAPDDTPAIVGLSLYNADNEQFIRPITPNDTIVLSEIGTSNISIIAEPNDFDIGSVLFNVNGDPDFKLENGVPYTLAGDGGGDILAWDYDLDTPYTITATAYTESGGNGEAGGSYTSNFTIVQEIIIPVNQPPIIGAIADQNSMVGDVISLQVSATDPENDPIILGASSLPTGLSISASGLISGTIADGADTQSPYSVVVTAQDNQNNTSQIAFSWTVAPLPVPPAAPSNLVATATSETSIQLTWQDNANNETGFEVRRQTQNGMQLIATLPADANNFVETDLQADTQYCYQVRSFNADFSSADTTLTCATTPAPPPNQDPVIQSIANVSMTEGEAVNITVQASDPDGDAVTVSMTSAPAFAQFLAPNTIQLVPQIGDAGGYTVTVQAADTNGGVTSLTFNVSVAAAPDDTPAVIGLSLYDATNDQFIRALAPNETIVLSEIGTTEISISAETNNVNVGSVVFALNDDASYQTESVAPYTLAGDSNGDYRPWNYSLNTTYTITGTAYTESGGNGEAGGAYTTTFTIVEDLPIQAAEVESAPILEQPIIESPK